MCVYAHIHMGVLKKKKTLAKDEGSGKEDSSTTTLEEVHV